MTGLKPDDIRAELIRAGSLLENGNLHEAENICRRILAASPENVDACYLLGLIYQNTGQTGLALASYNTVINRTGGHADAFNNLGMIYEASGNTGKAIDCYEHALHCNSSHGIANYNLGRLLRTTGEPEKAIPCLRTAAGIMPDSDQVQLELGMSLMSRKMYEEALQCLRRARELNSANPSIHNMLGNLHQQEGRIEAALACYRSAIRLKPDFAEAWNNLGSALLVRGDVQAALDNYRAARALKPEWQGAASNILLAENYICEDPYRLYTDHSAWGETISSEIKPAPLPGGGKNNTRTRIGYISPDFRAHSVAWFLTAHLKHYDRTEFEIVCFSDVASPDRITQEIKSLVTGWHNIYGMSDHEVAGLIRRADVDILVDLAGHTANNRLAVFAIQPVPVQASYLGYPNTTGLTSVRYRISDKWADPPGPVDGYYTENLVRLPGGFLCYTPPASFPEPAMPPVLSNKQITFGSFNVLAKISDHCVESWCKILDQAPGSRLLLKSAGLQDGRTREYHLNRFSRFGIAPGRIELVPRTTDFGSHMQLYSQVDISLDTFPYNGTTTSCESLWMGVPVITLAGNRHAGRVGNSLLNQAGLGELVAADTNGYLSLAGELANDHDHLRRLRQSLRERMASSSLCDGTRFTLELEAAFREMLVKPTGN